MVRAPSTKHGYWLAAGDVKGGQYFKYMGKWYLALGDARAYTEAVGTGKLYAWAIQAMNSDGLDQWVGIWRSNLNPELVEGYAEGKRPGPFTPATLRRKATAHRQEAARQNMAADSKEILARRLELGTVAG